MKQLFWKVYERGNVYMKVLLTSDWYAPAVNGVVTSILNLRKGLEMRGHEVRILTLSQTPHTFTEGGVTYIGSVPAGLIYPGARLRAAFSGKPVRELIEWEPDIVHSNCELSTFWPARRIAQQLSVPLVHTYHTVYENYTHYISPGKKWGRKMAKALSCCIAARVDCFITPTEKVKRLLEGYSISTPAWVVPTGIELSSFAGAEGDSGREAIRAQLGIPENHTVLVSAGRLAKEKNCAELLRALCGFRHQPVTLLFVGDGPCRSQLEEEARALGLGRQVLFSGMVPPQEMHRYYHAGDLFVSASTSETQGLTYLEALASGLPLLCRRDACLQGVLLEGKNGWAYETEGDFSDKLSWFLAHPQLQARFQREAASSSRAFSVPAFAEQIERVYRQQIQKYQALQGARAA